jgi:hypothetical protein
MVLKSIRTISYWPVMAATLCQNLQGKMLAFHARHGSSGRGTYAHRSINAASVNAMFISGSSAEVLLKTICVLLEPQLPQANVGLWGSNLIFGSMERTTFKNDCEKDLMKSVLLNSGL